MALMLQVPFSAGGLGKTNGCEDAPAAIVAAVKAVGAREDGRPVHAETRLVPVDNSDIEVSQSRILKAAARALADGETPVLLGGDHSISFPAVSALSSAAPGCGIVVFDAHPDCMDDFATPSHEGFLRQLVDQGIVAPSRIFLVGIRASHPSETAFIKEKGIRFFPPARIAAEGIDAVCDALMESLTALPAVHVSVDIDCVDPAFAPATGHPAPAGMLPRELLHMLSRLRHLKNLRSFDVVEANPRLSGGERTVALAAAVVRELL
ncbi:arginase family protein [Candidatus Woesearchaeota archaeon]|nr:arginase family protein [Candidatus Woesearchaeota archaeon]